MAQRDPVTEAERRLRSTELVLAALRRSHRDAELAALVGAAVPGPSEEDVLAGEVAVIEARDGCWEARHVTRSEPPAAGGGPSLFLLCVAGLLGFLAWG